MSKICVSLMVERQDQVPEAMLRARDLGANLLEWRLDATKEPHPESVVHLAPLPVIATVRSVVQGGAFAGGREEGLRLLLRAAAAGSSFLDWEFDPGRVLPSRLFPMRDRVIASWHNFQQTPPPEVLEDILAEMAATGAGIVKIVTHATRRADNLTVLGLIERGLKLERRVVAFCLGPLGRISRVACPLVGGAFTYASLEPGSEAAPGQITVTEMRRLLELLQ